MDDQEIWKDINGYEGWYQISSFGRVRSLNRVIIYSDGRKVNTKGKIIKQGNCKGYNTVWLHKNGEYKNYRVCRLVAFYFIDNPNKLPQVNHKDEDTYNDTVQNLEWCTMEYNNSYGSRILRSHASAEKNRREFFCHETGKKYRSIAKCARELGLLSTGINNVLKKRAHKHRGYHFSYTDEEVI